MIGKQTTLDLNGPILSFTQQPQSVSISCEDVLLGSVATFVGIVTATFPQQSPENPATNTGIVSYRWYGDGGPLFDDPPTSGGDGVTISGSATTTLSLYNNTRSKKIFLRAEYVPSAYSQPLGSAVDVGTARSTGNAINEPIDSNIVDLDLKPTIILTSQPLDQTAAETRNAVFSTSAFSSDGSNISYQWQFNDSNLSDATEQTTSTTPVSTTLTITDNFGQTTTVDFASLSTYSNFIPGRTYTLVSNINIEFTLTAAGAGGATSISRSVSGGAGGLSQGTFTFLAGQTYTLVVGAGGGGYTGLFLGSVSQANAIIIAGGGGGGANDPAVGGAGGGTTGGNSGNAGPRGGFGGTQSAGGSGGGSSGSALAGGSGSTSGGAAGGGGYFGGGGGTPFNICCDDGAGGGGSGYIHPTLLTSAVTTQGAGSASDVGGTFRIDLVSAVDYTGTSTYDVQGAQGDEDPSERFRIFDGSLSTFWQYYGTVNRTDPYRPTIVTLASGISYSSSVRVYWVGYPASNRNVTMNGGSYTSVGTDAGWITLATGSGTLNSITTLYTNSGGARSGYGQIFVNAIEVDGVILTDPQPWNTVIKTAVVTASGTRTPNLTIRTDTLGLNQVKCIISHPTACNSPIITRIANFNVVSAREILNFESVNDNGTFLGSGSVNLFNNPTTFNADPNNVARSLVIYPPEKDIRIRITLAAGAGASRGSRGGEGGLSVFEYTLKQNTEYTLKLGAATMPTGGSNGGGGAAYLYEKARLIAVCGGGGGSGTSGRGGDGGGIGVGGENGQGRNNGSGGRVVTTGNLPSGSGAFRSGSSGGQVSGCTVGDYYRSIGFSPCQDVGQRRWTGFTGSVASQTAVIQRGYKAGLGYRNNGGNGGGNEGGGGSGAYGGNAAVGDGSGGGGGSGYTDGSIAVISTRLGGNNSTNAFARIETFV